MNFRGLIALLEAMIKDQYIPIEYNFNTIDVNHEDDGSITLLSEDGRSENVIRQI